MNFVFDPRRGLIVVSAEIWGPSSSGVLQLALDTGATLTAVSGGMLIAIGYHPGSNAERVQITTESGVEFAPRIILDRVSSLGQERIGFPVLGHTLPPSASVDGLLGLDFLRGLNLAIDFRAGLLSLS